MNFFWLQHNGSVQTSWNRCRVVVITTSLRSAVGVDQGWRSKMWNRHRRLRKWSMMVMMVMMMVMVFQTHTPIMIISRLKMMSMRRRISTASIISIVHWVIVWEPWRTICSCLLLRYRRVKALIGDLMSGSNWCGRRHNSATSKEALRVPVLSTRTHWWSFLLYSPTAVRSQLRFVFPFV